MILKQFLYILLADYRKILVSLHIKRAFPKQNKDMKDNEQELFPLVDEEGKVIGKATRGECHSGSRLLHAVVHLHVFNSKGEVYDSKRERELVVPALLLVQISQ